MPFDSSSAFRRHYGNSNVELVYTGETPVAAHEGLFSVLSDKDEAGRHTAVLSLEEGVQSNDVLSAIITGNLTVNSFRELIPRMNDIFIELVKGQEVSK